MKTEKERESKMARTELRDYQKFMVNSIHHDQKEGFRRTYAVLPTGTGKTRVACELIYARVTRGYRCLWIVHTRELVRQAAEAIRNVLEGTDTGVGIVMADDDHPNEQVVVASVQTIRSDRLDTLGAFDLVIVDECHHISPDNGYAYILDNIKGTPAVVGITATPFRHDQRRMQEVLPRCSFERTIPDMIREGWLCDLQYVQVPIEGLDLSGVKLSRRLGEVDFSDRYVAPIVEDGKIINATVDATRPYIEARGDFPAVAFCASIEHSQQLAAAYNYVGINAAAIWGTMKDSDRAEVMAKWLDGRIQLVTNCAVLTEGFDYPRISTVIIARPTMSVGLYTQMIGRGTRLADDKDDCLILDITGRMPAKAKPVHLDDILGEEISTDNGAVVKVTKKDLNDKKPRVHALRDPFGRAQFAWTQHPFLNGVWFTPVSEKLAAVMIPDPSGSGLYRPYLCPKEAWKALPLREASDEWVPMRQAIADLEFTLAKAGVVRKRLSNRGADWRSQMPSDKQMGVLHRFSPQLYAQAVSEAWSKGDVSLAIDAMTMRNVIYSEMFTIKKEGS